jgi:sulfur relay (sulfurtransferase) complex TusBCD TusD component (DsrE family)
MKLAILLTARPETEDGRTVSRLSRSAVEMGHEVDIFFMDDGVFCLRHLEPLMGQGVRFTVCAHNAYERGLDKMEGALFGGQNDWAEIVSQADRVIAFG